MGKGDLMEDRYTWADAWLEFRRLLAVCVFGWAISLWPKQHQLPKSPSKRRALAQMFRRMADLVEQVKPETGLD